VVCLSVVQPMLHELPSSEIYTKTLLLGIAFSINIGGMTTPISSPQNLVAINVIQGTTWNTPSGPRAGAIGWPEMLSVTMPFTICCVFSVWVYLWLFFRPQLQEVEPLPPRELEPFTVKHTYVIVVCICTIALWALNTTVEPVLGGTGIVALIPVVCFFATEVLDKNDFKELSWEILILLAGGLALGDAIQSSGLLAILAKLLATAVEHSSLWVIFLTFASFIWLFGNFISHTVAAMLVLPVVANVGCYLGLGDCDAGHFRMLVLGSVLMDSGAMGLAVTSFPNAAVFSLCDPAGKRYLSQLDFIKTVVILGLIELVLVMTIGYELLDSIIH